MSRIGKLPIIIPAGVTVTHKDDIVTVKGPKGELSQYVNPAINVVIEDGKLTMEENVESGGFGEKVRECLDELQTSCRLLSIAIPDEYVEHGNVSLLYQEVGIDADSVIKRIVTAYAPISRQGEK